MWERYFVWSDARNGIGAELSDEPCASLGSRHHPGAAWEAYCDPKARSKVMLLGLQATLVSGGPVADRSQ